MHNTIKKERLSFMTKAEILIKKLYSESVGVIAQLSSGP